MNVFYLKSVKKMVSYESKTFLNATFDHDFVPLLLLCSCLKWQIAYISLNIEVSEG